MSSDTQTTSANERQVGGSHYKTGGEEHWDRVARLGLDYFQGQITKYVERWKKKNGLEDLKKARHFLDKYIEIESAKTTPWEQSLDRYFGTVRETSTTTPTSQEPVPTEKVMSAELPNGDRKKWRVSWEPLPGAKSYLVSPSTSLTPAQPAPSTSVSPSKRATATVKKAGNSRSRTRKRLPSELRKWMEKHPTPESSQKHAQRLKNRKRK